MPDGPATEAFVALAEVWAGGVRLDEAVAQVRREHPEGAWALEVVGDGAVRAVAAPKPGLKVGRLGFAILGMLGLALGLDVWQRVSSR